MIHFFNIYQLHNPSITIFETNWLTELQLAHSEIKELQWDGWKQRLKELITLDELRVIFLQTELVMENRSQMER